MNCPCCPETNLVLSERQGIEIDYCPKCRGIWLDRGELDKIIEKTKDSTSEHRRFEDKNSQYQQDSYHKPYKRKKSFLEELFD